jgi:hypothetical protein
VAPVMSSNDDETKLNQQQHLNIAVKTMLINESFCDASLKPSNVTECSNDETCPRWIISNWSPCRGACGVGFRTRLVYCSSNKPPVCANLPKPSTYENCTVDCLGHWKPDNWTDVSDDDAAAGDIFLLSSICRLFLLLVLLNHLLFV